MLEFVSRGSISYSFGLNGSSFLFISKRLVFIILLYIYLKFFPNLGEFIGIFFLGSSGFGGGSFK